MSGRQGESGIVRSKGSKGAGKSQAASNTVPPTKGARKQRTADLGRALRSVYDDTLRESVPSDFTELLGKLN